MQVGINQALLRRKLFNYNEEMLQLRDAMGELSAKIFPFIEIYGFLDRDEILE